MQKVKCILLDSTHQVAMGYIIESLYIKEKLVGDENYRMQVDEVSYTN